MYKGIALSVLASITLVFYIFTPVYWGDFDGQQTFGWRIISTLPFLTLFMLFSGDFAHVKSIGQRLLKNPFLIFVLLLTSFHLFPIMVISMGTNEWSWFTGIIGLFPFCL